MKVKVGNSDHARVKTLINISTRTNDEITELARNSAFTKSALIQLAIEMLLENKDEIFEGKFVEIYEKLKR
jgi:hypothetical protein